MTTKAHLSPAEAEALKAIEAAEAAGNDPFGDLDDNATDAIAERVASEAAAEAEAEATTEQQAGEATTEADGEQAAAVDEAVLNELADPLGINQPAPTAYKTEIPADLEAKRDTLMTEKAEALEKLMSGEIDAKQYATTEAKVQRELSALDRTIATAETLAAINAQSSGQYEGQVIAQIVENTKGVLDYTKDATAQKQFDAVMAGLRADPANATKNFGALAAEANKAVLAIRGLSLPGADAPNAGAKTTTPPARPPAGKLPPSLRNLPAAATPHTGGGVAEQMANLKGTAFEDSFAKLSPAQQAALLGE